MSFPVFPRVHGYAPDEIYHRDQNLNAKKLLIESSESIKEIAYKIGFNDEKAFMKKFKQFEDITPTKYRNAFSRAKIVR
ncbi:MAG: helix-turn-helix domain-containing protein [Treponema sp.]|nr:helix-turn-helix domain-containing protein [Treponema sp.]